MGSPWSWLWGPGPAAAAALGLLAAPARGHGLRHGMCCRTPQAGSGFGKPYSRDCPTGSGPAPGIASLGGAPSWREAPRGEAELPQHLLSLFLPSWKHSSLSPGQTQGSHQKDPGPRCDPPEGSLCGYGGHLGSAPVLGARSWPGPVPCSRRGVVVIPASPPQPGLELPWLIGEIPSSLIFPGPKIYRFKASSEPKSHRLAAA